MRTFGERGWEHADGENVDGLTTFMYNFFMIEIKEVKTKKQKKEFLKFPLKLYKHNKCYVPPLYSDEKKIFKKNYVYYDTCEAVYFNAYRSGKMVGRISGILQKAHNEKTGEKRIRFTRFDAIDDQKVATALFNAVEDWGRSLGMDTICGPLGFSDLEREGLLIEGFDQMSTFEEQYNAEYYGRLIENCGYVKEVDWIENKIFLPDDEDDGFEQTAAALLERRNLHFADARNTRKFIKKYKEGFFKLLDESYDKIYGTVPFTDGMKKMMISNFKLIIDKRFVAAVVDENDEIVCLGICFPAIGKALQKSKGKMTPAALVRLLYAIKCPKVIDLGLVGVAPSYLNKGVSSAVFAGLRKMLREEGIDYAETNLMLEHNNAIQNQWKRFRTEQHKRRRSYIKAL